MSLPRIMKMSLHFVHCLTKCVETLKGTYSSFQRLRQIAYLTKTQNAIFVAIFPPIQEYERKKNPNPEKGCRLEGCVVSGKCINHVS